MNIYTIGFTQKTAEEFFRNLKENNIDVLVDIRLRPKGQLSGFAKQEDLEFFLKELINSRYVHIPELAPTKEILNKYRKDKNWSNYERRFIHLLRERNIIEKLDKSLFEKNNCCLLCSEPTPEKCHRRLVGEFLADHWEDVNIIHL